MIPPDRYEGPAYRAAARLALVVTALCSIVLIGWLLDVAILRQFGVVWAPMTPLTAVLLILLGQAIVWSERQRAVANATLVFSSVLAAAVLTEYFFEIQTGASRLSQLFQRGGELPELPAPDTAAAALLVALTLLSMRSRNRYLHDLADVIASLVGIVCLQVLIEYTYNIVSTASFTGFRQVAPHSTVSMILLMAAVVARRPTAGLYGALRGKAQSASLLRRLLPITLLLCVIAGWLQVLAAREGVGGTFPVAESWAITGFIVVLSVLLFVTSGEMRKAEATVRRREEELLAATAAAEAASETKSRFMAVMSHELRTPLTAVIGYTDLLDAGVAGELPKPARDLMGRIRASSWHLVGMIDAVLVYAGGRVLAGQNTNVQVAIADLLREVMDTVAAQAREKGLTLELIAPLEPLVISIDPTKLRHILMNLVGNAVKFTDQGSVTIRVRSQISGVALEVSDTGPGIAPADLQRIWEPFQLVDDTHTRMQGGMGLGLALAQRLAEQLGARIDVTSTVGQGTTFTVTLPPISSEPTHQTRLETARILVVDDETAVRRIMARALARHGAIVQEAESAQEALDKLANGPIDLLVTDISMPNMTGLELARVLRARGDTMPILFVTGAELDDKDEAEAVVLGRQLLRKPFDMSELARVVAGFFD